MNSYSLFAGQLHLFCIKKLPATAGSFPFYSGFRRYLKTKKMTNSSQRRGRFEAKTRRNPSGFQVFLTKKQSAFVEIVKIFDFSDTP